MKIILIFALIVVSVIANSSAQGVKMCAQDSDCSEGCCAKQVLTNSTQCKTRLDNNDLCGANSVCTSSFNN